jgi:NAD/NADP transhydrogenase beta subunit
MLTLSESGPISKLPLSQTVFGYTLAYLSYFIGVNNLQTQNIATFIIFPVVVIADFIWSTTNGCASPEMLITALIIGGLIGVLWAMIIDSTNMANLAYFSGINNKDVCSQPSRSMYKCRPVKKNPNASSQTKT